MAITPGILDKVGHQDVGGGSPVLVDQFLVNAPSFTDESTQVPTGAAVDKRVGYRQRFEHTLYDYSLFAALNTKQLAATPIELVYRWAVAANNNWVYSPVYFAAAPVFGQIPDIAKIHIAAAGTVGDPTGLGTWTDLGLIAEGSQPQMTANTKNEGLSRPIYVTMSLQHTVDFLDFDVASAGLTPFDGAKIKVAIEHADGTFLMYDNVDHSSIPNPVIGLGEVVTRNTTFSAANRTLATIFIPPVTPPLYFYGVRLTGVAAGASEADILTITTV